MAIFQVRQAQILQQRSHVIPGKIRITEYFFEVPLDYSKPSGESLRLFARGAERVKNPARPKQDAEEKLPWFLYLQGGPGHACPPVRAGEWQDSAMDKGYKILMLDTRGNGLSTTVTTELLLKRGGPEEQAEYLKFFRADNIVRDAEAIRMALTKDYPDDLKKWSILGQSFGGFCALNYLSKSPVGLREVFITGGLGPLREKTDLVYVKLMRRAWKVSQKYYEKFPEDVERMHRIIHYVSRNEVNTPTGGLLLPERIQNLGIGLGFTGFVETLHSLILRMDNDLDLFGAFTRPTLTAIDQESSFDTNILYAILHEPLYASNSSTNWSAERIMKEAGFDAVTTKAGEPIMFTAEMVTHNTFKSFASLRPLLPAAEILAETTDWPELYDEKQLAANEVPVYAATYVEDLYVDFDLSQVTASKIKGCKQFITNTLDHNGVRANPKIVMEELFKLRDDVNF